MAAFDTTTSASDEAEPQDTADKFDTEKDEAHDAIKSATSTESIDPVDQTATTLTAPPPVQDGGSRAWLQVLGSFLVFSNLWGFTFAFGSFQSYYELTYLTTQTASEISWIGTVSVFLLISGGTLSGPLFDLGYFRTMLFAGAVSVVAPHLYAVRHSKQLAKMLTLVGYRCFLHLHDESL